MSGSLNSAEQPVASSVYIDERSQLQTELNPAGQIPILGCPQDYVQLPPVPESSNMLAPLEDARRKMLEETVTDLTKRIFIVEQAVLRRCRCRQEFMWSATAEAFPDESAGTCPDEVTPSNVKMDEATAHRQMLAEEMTELSKTVFILEQAVLRSCTCRGMNPIKPAMQRSSELVCSVNTDARLP